MFLSTVRHAASRLFLNPTLLAARGLLVVLALASLQAHGEHGADASDLCVLQGSEAMDELLDAGVYAWAAAERCDEDGIALGNFVKCGVDVARAVESTNRMITVIIKTMRECGELDERGKHQHELGLAVSKMTTHLAGLTAASGGVIQECPNLVQKSEDLVMRDTLRSKFGEQSLKDPLWLEGEGAKCIMDVKDSMRQVFKTCYSIARAAKDCDKAGKCSYYTFDILFAFAGLAKYLMGIVGHCYKKPLPLKDFPLTCTEQITDLVHSLGGFAADAARLSTAKEVQRKDRKYSEKPKPKLEPKPKSKPKVKPKLKAKAKPKPKPSWHKRSHKSHHEHQEVVPQEPPDEAFEIENVKSPALVMKLNEATGSVEADPVQPSDGPELAKSQWRMRKVGSGHAVVIENVDEPGEYLDVSATEHVNGSPADVWDDPMAESAQWQMRKVGLGNTYNLESMQSPGEYLHIPHEGHESSHYGASVDVSSDPSSPAAEWKMDQVPAVTTQAPRPTMVVVIPEGEPARLYNKDVSTPAPSAYDASLLRRAIGGVVAQHCVAGHCLPQPLFCKTNVILASIFVFSALVSFLLGMNPSHSGHHLSSAPTDLEEQQVVMSLDEQTSSLTESHSSTVHLLEMSSAQADVEDVLHAEVGEGI